MDALRNLSKSVRIWVLIISLVFSLMLLCNFTGANKDNGIGLGNGLSYGLDFAGGTELWLRLENPVSPENMSLERGILENRLNAMGLKDIPVTVYGDQHIIVRIAKASPEEIKAVEDILRQQARFEQRIDGELAVKGSEISLDTSSQASGIYPYGSGYQWVISVKLDSAGAERFGRVAQGKFFGQDNPKNRPVDIFIDRPENTVLLVSSSFYGLLGNTTTSSLMEAGDIYYGDSALKVIMNRSAIPVVAVHADVNKTLEELREYKEKGYNKAIIGEDEFKVNDTVRNLVQDMGISIQKIPVGNKTIDVWIKEVTGLKTSPRLNFDTRGEPVYAAQLTGGGATLEEAKRDFENNKIWLTSGNLPQKAHIESKSTIPASLGAQFLRYSLLTGLLGVVFVALIIFIRYRKLYIVVPTMITGLSEIVIILGVAALIKWEIDLPAIAGIIASVGTGVDNQIVITDETIASRTSGENKRTVSVAERIKRAFFIIFTSAATIIAIMLPLMTFVAGTLKGFALITILGVLIGIFITRPAYARMIEEFLKHERE